MAAGADRSLLLLGGSRKFLKKLRSAINVASRPEDDVPEQTGNPTSQEITETGSEALHKEWGTLVSEEELQEAYDTIIEIHGGSPYLEGSTIEAVGEDVLVPGGEAYDGRGESLEVLRKKLDGDSLVVAFGFEGGDLPNYSRLMDEDVNPEGNWWDSPEELDVDYLFDETTYTGAVNVPGFKERYVFASEGVNRDVYLVDES